MIKILEITPNLYIDLATGNCSNSKDFNTISYSTYHLTRSQLILLNYLIENQNRICTFSSLESLFDDHLESDQFPGIKQQISRIKTKLRKLDSSFDKKLAGEIFQSVSGIGYTFDPSHRCRIYSSSSINDVVISVNRAVLEHSGLTPSEKENIRNVFYHFPSYSDIIFQAVLNKLHITNMEYTELIHSVIKYIFEMNDFFSPVFLMSGPGSGKTTFLCALCITAAENHPGWNIYYLSFTEISSEPDLIEQLVPYLKENGISRTRKTLLCLDDICDATAGFIELFRILSAQKFPYLYILIAGKISETFDVMERFSIFHKNSRMRIAYIENTMSDLRLFRNSAVLFEKIKYYTFPSELKRDILYHMFSNYCHRLQAMDTANFSFPTTQQTIIDLFYAVRESAADPDYCVCSQENFIPATKMDWDEWQKKCYSLDPFCSKLLISEIFPYIAACQIFEVPITFEFIHTLTGFSYKSKLYIIFPRGLGETFQFVDDVLRFRHSAVARYFFLCHNEYSLYSCIYDMFTRYFPDESTLFLLKERILCM